MTEEARPDVIDLGDGFHSVDPRKIRDLRPDVLDANGRMRILPASFWASTTPGERAWFGACTGIYSFPTVELVARLKEIIAGRKAIEIGAGNGVLAEALGIVATDNFQQRMPKYKLLYALQRWTTVPYGDNVVDMHASRAVRHYKPDVVIGCWVTHKYDPRAHARGGNEIGVDEPDILRHCAAYVFVGNKETHALKPIWDRPHSIEYPSYVYARAPIEGRDFIAIFPGYKAQKGLAP